MNYIGSKTVQVITALILILAAGCATVYNPVTEKKEIIFIDERSEIAIGAGTAKRLEKQYPLSEDRKAIEYVNRIGQEVARVGDRPNLEYHFKVLDIEQVNAFALPGGFVYVTKALLDRVDDDELAAVLGHEIGHITARHGIKKLQTQLGYNLISTIVFREGKYKDIERAVDLFSGLISLGYGRKDELASDRLGTRYSYRAGYELQGMISFLKKLKEMEKREPFVLEILLNTHPPVSERIKVVEEEINKLRDKEGNTGLRIK